MQAEHCFHVKRADAIPSAETLAPKVHPWGGDGPPVWSGEIRRHVYKHDNLPVKIKIKRSGNEKYTQLYRVDGGWQSKRPDRYVDIPYASTAINAFDPELRDDHIFWPEGEKDVDTLSRINLPAFTFGGIGDGLPEAIDKYLVGRHLVILADNDDRGRAHAEEKAERAHAAGAASIKIVHFPELSPKDDVSDFIEAGGTTEQLIDRANAAPLWRASLAESATSSNDDGGQLQLVMRCMADVQPERIEWLWPGRIAIGKQTLIGGEPGLGKSQITAALAAAVTTGLWPCDEGRAPKGSVLILSAEDDAADTIRPRLDAAGADPYAVRLISAVVQSDGKGRRTFNLQADLSLLETAIKSIGDVRLVIIDPVITRYRETSAWTAFSLATRRQRENIFKQVLASAGDKPIARITTDTIAAGRDRRIKTPFQARHFLDTMRGLFRWAAKAKLVKADPTAGVEDPAVPKTEGFPVWTEENVAAFEKRWPIGTRQRVWLDILLYTGLRRGDAVRFGRQHIRDGIGTIKTEKTDTEVTLPILPMLAETLAAGPQGDLALIANKNGQPFAKEAFGNAFKDACRAAGVPGSAHGLRKIAATRAANAGATVAQLEAIFGWSGGRMASLYTRAADRRRVAIEGMHKLANS